MSIRAIQAWVAEQYDLPLDWMLSERAARHCAHPRQIAMYLARNCTRKTLPAIGDAFNRDHTTVMASVRKVDERAADDPMLGAWLAAAEIEMRAVMGKATEIPQPVDDAIDDFAELLREAFRRSPKLLLTVVRAIAEGRQ